MIFASATAWLGFNPSGWLGRMCSCAYGSRSAISEVIAISPRSSSLRTVAAVVSARSSKFRQ